MTDNHNTSVTEYDLVVIGGGIYGCAVLWEATHRGLKTLLLEKNDFCAATSANSLKTIHGGIRYLQQLNLKRTIESDKEKVILSKIAPNIIKPLDCCLPTTKSLTKNSLSFYVATLMFNALSCLSPLGSGRHRNLFTKADVKRSLQIFDPKFTKPRKRKFASYMVWQDAQATNAEMLGLAFIRSARLQGGTAKNYHPVTLVTQSNNAYDIEYKTDNSELSKCTARYVVDCTGANQFSNGAGDFSGGSPESYVAAINLVLNEQFSQYAFALPSYNERLNKKGMLFFSPWKNTTLAGTWYFTRAEISSREDVTQAIIKSCIDDIESALSNTEFLLESIDLNKLVIDFHLGFLPSDANNQSPEDSLRSHAVIKKDGGYYCLQGNKYTTARLNAKNLVDLIAKGADTIKQSQSHKLPLKSVARYTQVDSLDHPSNNPVLKHLAERYGDLFVDFQSLLKTDAQGLTLVPDSSTIYQIEIDYFAQDCDTKTLADVLYRRINHNTSKPVSHETIKWCAHRMATFLSWDEQRTDVMIKQVDSIESQKTVTQ